MTKYHPLYAYAVVSVVLILGIQMMLTEGPQEITGFAVADQQGGTQQGGNQQGDGTSGKIQELSEESKECLDAIDEKIKDDKEDCFEKESS